MSTVYLCQTVSDGQTETARFRKPENPGTPELMHSTILVIA